jgi:hypothetical protein
MTTSMTTINHQLTQIYVIVDDFFKAHPHLAQWRHSPNDLPPFTDAEVLTIALMQGCLGVQSLKEAYQLIANNYHTAFPHLCSDKQWLGRLHALTNQIRRSALGDNRLARWCSIVLPRGLKADSVVPHLATLESQVAERGWRALW